MATLYIRPTRSGGGNYGSGDGSDADNAYAYNNFQPNFATITGNDDTLYFYGVDENGNAAPFSGENACQVKGTNITVDGRPPGSSVTAEFTDPAQGQPLSGDPAFYAVSATTSGDTDGLTIKNVWFRAPRAISSGVSVIVANMDNITFDNCKFTGNGQAAHSTSNGSAVYIYQTTFGNKAGIGGCGLVTFHNCVFEDFGTYALRVTYSGSDPTWRAPLRFIADGCEFSRVTRPIICKGAVGDALFDTYYNAPGAGTLSDGMVNQFLLTNSRFHGCADWNVDMTWPYDAHGGFHSGIYNCDFVDAGIFYTGESQNVINTHGCYGGAINNNRFINWQAGATSDGCAVIADHYIGASVSYGSQNLQICGNYFRRGITHPERVLADGLNLATMLGESRPKAIGIWNSTNTIIRRNVILQANVGVRIAPNNRNSGTVIERNTFWGNNTDILHQTGNAEVTASPTFVARHNRFLGGIDPNSGNIARLYNESGSPMPDAPTWDKNQLRNINQFDMSGLESFVQPRAGSVSRG